MKDKYLKIKELISRIFMDCIYEYKEWKVDLWERDMDELDCCSDYECGCNGRTVRQNYKREYYD